MKKTELQGSLNFSQNKILNCGRFFFDNLYFTSLTRGSLRRWYGKWYRESRRFLTANASATAGDSAEGLMYDHLDFFWQTEDLASPPKFGFDAPFGFSEPGDALSVYQFDVIVAKCVQQ